MPRVVVGSAERAADRVLRAADAKKKKDAALTALIRAKQYGAGFTMEQAAQAAGVNYRTYAKYLRDIDLMPRGVMRKLKDAFGITAEELDPLYF